MAWIDDDGEYNRLMINDPETGEIIPKNILVYGSVGAGKSLACEEMAHYYYRCGFTVIILDDVKDEYELAFSMFDPIKDYHLKALKRFGAPIGRIPTKIYHPFTFNIPHNTMLPKINFYTINIKELDRIDLQYLSSQKENKKSIIILIQELENMKRDEGLHHLIYKSSKQTENLNENSGLKLRSNNPDDFYSRNKQGTEKTDSDINNYFKPFIKDYTLTPLNCQYNIDYVSIMNDQKHYHQFSHKWINDRRQRTWYVLHLMNQFIRHKDHAKHPILFVIPEIRYLVPNTAEGFSSYLADTIKETLTTMRNQGKGYACIMDTQSMRDTSEKVLTSCNEKFIGRITSDAELKAIGDSLRLKTQDFDTFKSIERGEFVTAITDTITDTTSYQKFKLWLPPHRHKEQGYNFQETYEQEYADQMILANEKIEEIRTLKTKIEKEVEALKDKDNKEKTEAYKKSQREKNAPTKVREAEEKTVKTQMKVTEKEEQIKTLILNYHRENPEKSMKEIAEQFNIRLASGEVNKMKIKRIIDEANETKEETQ